MVKKNGAVEAATKTKQGKMVEVSVISDDGSADNIWQRFQCCNEMEKYLKKKSNRELAVTFNFCPFCTKDVRLNNNDSHR